MGCDRFDERETVRELDKRELLSALVGRLAQQLEESESRQRQSAADATHSEARAENSKDTRSLETSYLARGLAQRVEELREALARLRALKLRAFAAEDPIEVTALVALRDGQGAESLAFVLPAAGGEAFSRGRYPVKVVTPASPLGRALLGLCGGEAFEVSGAGRCQALEILWIR